MTGALVIEDFAPHVGEVFDVVVGDGSFQVTLAEAKRMGGLSPREGGAFSLIFTGPRSPYLRQGMYDMRCGETSWQLFLVPLGDKDGPFKYEAAFN
jgi:hypothetical protein